METGAEMVVKWAGALIALASSAGAIHWPAARQSDRESHPAWQYADTGLTRTGGLQRCVPPALLSVLQPGARAWRGRANPASAIAAAKRHTPTSVAHGSRRTPNQHVPVAAVVIVEDASWTWAGNGVVGACSPLGEPTSGNAPPRDEPSNDPALAVLRSLDPRLQNARTVKTLDDISVLRLSSRAVTDQQMMYVSRARNLVFLHLDSARLSDSGFRRISELERLQFLDLSDTIVTDELLSPLKCLGKLSFLDLGGTRVGDGRLAWIARCRSLRGLGLSDTKVNDSDLSGLTECKDLETLRLSRTQVSGEFLRHTKGCSRFKSLSVNAGHRVTDTHFAKFINGNAQLVFLDLGETNVADATAESLPSRVEILSLAGTKITDGGVKHIAALQSLKSLFLARTAVTDRGVLQLLRLRDLRYLDLGGTHVSEDAVQKLKERFKNLTCER